MRLRALLPRSFRDRLDLHRTAVSAFVDRVAASVPPAARILDAGAGEAPFRERFRHARYVSLDDGRGDDRWDYTAVHASGDLLAMPFRDGAFDHVLCTETLEHLTDPQRFLSEVARVLRPGGRLHMTAPLSFKEHQQPHDYFRYTRYGLALLLERAGLEPLAIEPEGGYFAYLGDKIQPLHRYLFRKDRALLWRVLFLILQPVSLLLFTVLAPLVLSRLDPLDRKRVHTTGFLVTARRPAAGAP